MPSSPLPVPLAPPCSIPTRCSYVLPKFAMGGPNSPSLLELKGRSGLDQGIAAMPLGR